jgi:AcrR family transcriptional regulator
MTRLTRDDIVAGAGRRFATYGYHGTSMRDLGDDLGILGSSIYAHVGGKQELLVAVIERGADFFETSAATALAANDSPEETLRLLISGHIGVLLDHRSEARTYLSEVGFLESAAQKTVASARDRYEHVFVDTIDRGYESGAFSGSGDPRLSAIYILSVLNAIDRWYTASGRLDRKSLADDVFAFMRGALGATSEVSV